MAILCIAVLLGLTLTNWKFLKAKHHLLVSLRYKTTYICKSYNIITLPLQYSNSPLIVSLSSCGCLCLLLLLEPFPHPEADVCAGDSVWRVE